MHQLPTGIVIFLFTDIEGSTQLWEQQPDAMRLALARHDACLRAAIETHHGLVFKTIGDAFCAAFARATDAIDAAIAVQQQLRVLQPSAVNSAELSLRVRVALHTGAAETREGDYFGPTLNRIARMLAVGHGGQILLSRTTYDLVENELPPGASLRDLGLHRLRDLLQPEHVYQLLHPDLPADFPALRSLSALSHNLPQQTTRFVGREPEMAKVKQLLASTRLLTLTGTGGTGKTRLSLQVAAELLSEYEDGVWLVELAALADPALVPQAVAVALAVREAPGKLLTETLVEYLKPRQLLLILDNCEHLLAPGSGPAPPSAPAHEACGCAELVHTLVRSCPHLHIVATSRERLNIQGEQTYRVPSLAAPNPSDLPPSLVGADLVSALTEFEAVQMLLDRAALVQSTFALTPRNARLVAQLCHRLGGIPLAIELAAARLKLLSVEQIAPRLDDMFRLLTGGSRAALPRQQTLRALIDWSYDLLSEAEQTLLRRLSVFAGGFTLEAVEAVCTGEIIEQDAVLDLLGQLVDKSLVWLDEQEAEPRYRLLETIRQYGSDKLWTAGEGAVARLRYRGWLLRLAERALSALSGPERAVWLQRLLEEYDNLRAALGPAARTHPPGETGGEREDLPLFPARLARWGQVVEQLVPLYRHLSRGEAALGILEDYIALCQAEGNAPWLARAFTLMGIFLRLNPHLAGRETSRSMFERAIAVCEAHGLHDWVAYPRARLAHDLAMDAADLELAEALARACPPDADTARDVQWLVSDRGILAPTIYTTLMWVAAHRADWEALKDAFGRSLAWGGPTKNPLLEMLTKIEETCHRQGADATFRDLCRFMADGYARVELEAPLQQWYLEPTLPQSLPGEPWLREEFEEEGWHPSLQWQDVTGRSRVDRAARPGWLGLYPAEGCDLWPEKDLNAPRLVATVRGDFVAQTRVELGGDTSALAGLLVWRDEQHFARLELQSRRAGWDRVEPVLEACVGGQFQQFGRGQCARQAMWLRFERVRDELRGLCSEDGEQWLACGRLRLPQGATEEVGLAAIAYGSGGYAWFDTFLLWGQGVGGRRVPT